MLRRGAAAAGKGEMIAVHRFGRIRHNPLARLKPGRDSQRDWHDAPHGRLLPWRTSQKRAGRVHEGWQPSAAVFHLYSEIMTEIADTFDAAFTKAVDLGNRIADKDKDADLWDIADGLLAGALQYWLYSRQPCGDPRCQDCMPISTARGAWPSSNA